MNGHTARVGKGNDMRVLTKLFRCRSGSAAIQYALISAVIAVVLAGILNHLGPDLQSQYQKIAEALGKKPAVTGTEAGGISAIVTGSVTPKRD